MTRRALLCTALLLAGCGDDEPVTPARREPKPMTDAARARLTQFADPSTWEAVAGRDGMVRDPRTGITFVRIPAGTFTMGGGVQPQEQPQHEVEITRDYLLAQTELTVGQWQRYVDEYAGDPNVELPQGGDQDPTLPMTLNLLDAQRFAKTFSYRLPTEVEWERACTGGQSRAAEPWSSEAGMREHAWFHRNADYRAHPVAQKAANAYGLHDMLGNLWEWCADHYDPKAYEKREPRATDPTTATGGPHHVIRGGSWFSVPPATPRTRLAELANKRSAFYGVRFAVTPN